MTGTGNLERFLVKVKKGFEIKIDRLILTRIQNRIPNTKYNFLQAYAGQAKESNTATGEKIGLVMNIKSKEDHQISLTVIVEA